MTALYALLAIAPQQGAAVSPGKLISDCMLLYSRAQTLSGTIVWNQYARDVKVTTNTRLQIDRENMRVYVYQTQQLRTGTAVARIIADGKKISYPPPKNHSKREDEQLIEPQVVGGQQMSEKDSYVIGAAHLIDRSLPLGFLMSRRDDLDYHRGQIIDAVILRKDQLNDRKVVVVGGRWRDYSGAPETGKYEMWLAEDTSELLRFSKQELVQVVEGQEGQVTVTSAWDLNMKLNGPLDEALFKIN